MPKKSNLVEGEVFGQLTIVTKSECRGSADKSYYICSCSCGRKTEVSRSTLISGKTKSCGCLRYENASLLFKTGPGLASYNMLFARCKRGAKLRNIFFDLTAEQHKNLIIEKCDHCGRPPSPYNPYVNTNKKVTKCMKPSTVEAAWIVASGIDRVNSSLGYTISNCVPCCARCNYAKLDDTKEDYIEHCRRVVAYQDSK